MDVQVKHLGDEQKAGLFQKGALDVSAFTTAKGNALSIAALRKRDNARTFFFPTRQKAVELAQSEGFIVNVARPYDLLRNVEAQKELKALLIADAEDLRQSLSLTD